MKCNNCGAEVAEGMKFCPECGQFTCGKCDEWDEEVYAKHILCRQFEGDIDNQIIMSESEIQKFINLYGVDTGDEDYPDEWFSLSLVTDVPENNDGCVDVF